MHIHPRLLRHVQAIYYVKRKTVKQVQELDWNTSIQKNNYEHVSIHRKKIYVRWEKTQRKISTAIYNQGDNDNIKFAKTKT